MAQNPNQFGYDDVQINIYDPNEPDLNKKKIGFAKNINDFSAKHGVRPTTARRALANKTRVFSTLFEREVAIRLGKKEDEKGRISNSNNQVPTRRLSEAI